MSQIFNILSFEVSTRDFKEKNFYQEIKCFNPKYPDKDDLAVWFKKELIVKMFIDDDVIEECVNLFLVNEDYKYETNYFGSKRISNFYPLEFDECLNGVFLKERKYSIEWRLKKEDGYQNLKKFYSFEREQYKKAISSLRSSLGEIALSLPKNEDIDSNYGLKLTEFCKIMGIIK